MSSDKNLGPAIMERTGYIKLVFHDHLNDTNTYRRLTKDEASSLIAQTEKGFDDWFKKYKDQIDHIEYLSHHRAYYENNYNTFYVLPKVHKNKLSTRPIVSTSGTLLRALGVWCDEKLQIAARKQRSYFKDTFELKKTLDKIVLPPNAKLFTSNVVSMYTNIPTKKALQKIAKYLQSTQFKGIPVKALMKALDSVSYTHLTLPTTPYV